MDETNKTNQEILGSISLNDLPEVTPTGQPVTKEPSFFDKFVAGVKSLGGSQADNPVTGSIVAVPDLTGGTGEVASSELTVSAAPEGFGETATPVDTGGGGDTTTRSTTTDDSLSALGTALESLRTSLLSFSEGIGDTDGAEEALNNVQITLDEELVSAQLIVPDLEEQKARAEALAKERELQLQRDKQAAEAQHQRDLQDINEGFDVAERDLERKQRREQASLSVGLARAGGYLGFTGSGNAVMLNLQVTHDQEMSTLAAAKIAAINEAKRAFADANYKLGQEKTDIIEDLNRTIDERTDNHFNQMLQAADNARAEITSSMNQEKFAREKTFESLDIFAASNKIPSFEEIQQYAQELGVSTDIVQSAIQAKQNTRKLEEEANKDANQFAKNADKRATLNLVRQYPKGKFFTINGETYEGQATKSATGGDKVLDAQTVFKDFNNNQIARSFVGQGTANDLYEYFGASKAPKDFSEQVRIYSPDATDEEIQAEWEYQRRDALGFNLGRAIERFSPSNQEIILAQAQYEYDQRLREAGGDPELQRPLTFADLDAPDISEGRLNEFLQAGETRLKAERATATGSNVEDIIKTVAEINK